MENFKKELKKKLVFNCIMLVVFALLILTDIYYQKNIDQVNF